MNLAKFIEEMYKSKASFVSHTSTQVYDRYLDWLGKRHEEGVLEIGVETCLLEGTHLAMSHQSMPAFSNKEVDERNTQTLYLLLSTIGTTLANDPGKDVPVSATSTGQFMDRALGTKQAVDATNLSLKAGVAACFAKFGTLLMIMASVATVTVTCVSAYSLAKSFYIGARIARAAIRRVWAYAGTYKRVEKGIPGKKHSWLAWMAHGMGTREERFAMPSHADEKRAERDMELAVREFAPLSEAQYRATLHRPPVVNKNTCPRARRPSGTGKCGVGKVLRLNRHGHECCFVKSKLRHVSENRDSDTQVFQR
jgi:hypothetical protein